MIRKPQCKSCGEPHWFRYWVTQHAPGSRAGLCVGDFDLVVHRFRNCRDRLGSRDIEHYMVVEVKVADEKLGMAQRDTLSVFNGMLESAFAKVTTPIGVVSRPGFAYPGDKKVVMHGVHLLRVPKDQSDEGPFFWNNKAISAEHLAAVFAFERDPKRPSRILDIDRRHKKEQQYQLIEYLAGFVQRA